MTWRTRGLVAGAVCLALCGAFGAGRCSRPAKVVEASSKQASSSSKASATSAATVEAVADTKAAADTTEHVVIRWLPAVPAKGGCPAIPAHVEQETTKETHATSERQARRTSNETKKQEQSSQSTSTELHTVTTVYARPAWSLSVLGGAQFGAAPRYVPQLPSPVVVGLALERHIAGPVSAGAWVTSGGAGGLSVRLDW